MKTKYEMSSVTNISIKKARAEGTGVFEMARIPAYRSTLPFEIWTYSEGVSRNVEYNIPIIKVTFNYEEEAEVSIIDPIEVIAGTVPKDSEEDMKKVFNFVKTHQKAFLLHYNMVWDDCAILTYVRCVGKNKLSVKKTLAYLLEHQIIDDIPEEYQELFKED